MIHADDEVSAKLRDFAKKIESAQAAKLSPGQQQSPVFRFQIQLKTLQSLIAKGEYDRAQQMLAEGSYYEMPVELQKEWSDLIAALGPELEKKAAEVAQKRAVEIDQLVKDVRQTCLTAKESLELDPLLIRCAALQLRQSGREDIVAQRATRKINGVAMTLDAWASFLDQKNAENPKAVNDILRNLTNNQSQFPILTISEIEARYEEDESPQGPALKARYMRIFAAIKTPDDLPSAINDLDQLIAKAQKSGSEQFSQEKQKLETAQKTWELLKKNDVDGALREFEKFQNYGGGQDIQSDMDRLKDQIVSKIVVPKVSELSELKSEPGESLGLFVTRVMDSLLKQGNYVALTDAMKILDRTDRSQGVNPATRDRAIIEKFIAAQRFEAAGDSLAAMTNYREVVGWPGGKYAPTKLAGEALARLKASNPDIFKESNGVVLMEIRSLRQQIQTLRMNRPYSY